MKRLAPIILSLSLGSCGEDAAETLNALVKAAIEDAGWCQDMEGGTDAAQVPEDADTDTTMDTELISECDADLTAAADIDGDGQVTTDAEIQAYNDEVEARKTAFTEECTELGVPDDTECRTYHRNKRSLIRKIAKEACLAADAGFDADASGTLNATELKACADAADIQRKEVREDNRCNAEATGECGPMTKAELKGVAKAVRQARDTFVATYAPNDTLPTDDSAKTTLRAALKTAKDNSKASRASRKEAVTNKIQTGRTNRQNRKTARSS